MFEKKTVTIPFGEGKELVLETGKVARQAGGSVLARIGGTVVMANAVRSSKPLDHMSFFPLMVDYREKHYAVGRIPGNFFRREGRPGTPETITARLIDRTIRPLFPKGFKYEVQVYLTCLSMDQENPPSIVALNAASAALSISDIPFAGPVGAVRMGQIDGNFVLNPTYPEREESDLDLIVGGLKDAVTMVESGSDSITEDRILEAITTGHEAVQTIVSKIEELTAQAGKEKMEFVEPTIESEIEEAVKSALGDRLSAVSGITDKAERDEAVNSLKSEVVEKVVGDLGGEESELEDVEGKAKDVFDAQFKKNMRQTVIKDGKRADGRELTQVRPIDVETPFLPQTHGSALFTRGQTQSLGVTTLGTIGDQQKVDNLMGLSSERFLLHYNFPSYSVGETRRIMGPGRRELGHGMLAQRALTPILPDEDKFPYTIRIVSEITESNGSSSMASICSGCLSLMDAGVPIKAPVAGIAMGLIKEDDDVAILTDIMGMEDHLGDMDFKVAGTSEGITALQMDIKIQGLSIDIMKQALAQAKEARLHILGKMTDALPEARGDLAATAPRIEIVQIDPQKIGDLIGPSGKHIRGIVEATGAKIDVEDDGTVFIAAEDGESMTMAKQMVEGLTASPEVGKIYEGKVVRIVDFGCFVEIMPKQDGLVHISELDFGRVDKTEDICREGDIMKVKCIDVDPSGKVRLSRKEALIDEGVEPPEGYEESKDKGGRGGGGGGRGGRSGGGRDRGGRGGGGRDRGSRDRGGRDRGGRRD